MFNLMMIEDPLFATRPRMFDIVSMFCVDETELVFYCNVIGLKANLVLQDAVAGRIWPRAVYAESR